MFSIQAKTECDLLWTHQGKKVNLKCGEHRYMRTTRKQLNAGHSEKFGQ